MTFRSFKTGVVAVCITGVATAFLLEACLRAWGYSERYIQDPIYTSIPGVPEVDFIIKPGLRNARGPGEVVFDTDALGTRSSTPGRRLGPKTRNEIRIAVFGDSYTFGEGVQDTRDTYPSVLEEELRQRLQGKASPVVSNFGVSGYSVRQMTAALEHWATPFAPDICVMSVIPDDFDLEMRSAKVDPTGYTYNAARSGSWLQNSGLLMRFVREFRTAYAIRDLIAATKSPARDAAIVAEVPGSYSHVLDFTRIAKARGCLPAIVLMPDEQGFEVFTRRMDADGILYLDFSSLAREFPPEIFRASRFDRHPSATVHRAIGVRLADYLAANVLHVAESGVVAIEQHASGK